MKTVKLSPALKSAIWGGQRLKKTYGGKDMKNIAEAWALSCHEPYESTVNGGEYDGMTLADVLEKEGRRSLGSRCVTKDFPLLIKLIDAADKLSLQVHPDDDYAREHENEFGKTECWYILDSNEDSELIFGLKNKLTREQFEAGCADGSLLDSVRRVRVKKGDFAFIPAGTLHAIGSGILLAEIQQSSDCTYRVYDYGRLEDGKPRELHTKKAADVTDLEPSDAALEPMGKTTDCGGYSSTALAECEYFRLKKLDIRGEYTGEADGESFVSVLVIGGCGEYSDADGSIELSFGDSLFIPAGHGKFVLGGELEALVTTL